ncbi:MAG: A24 family peptidase [Rickettsiales bacterium]|nr:A24 family peptidase [Rickettsiales bacterium]
MGSLLATILNKLRKGEKVSFENFHCKKCGKKLKFRSLLPIVSFLVQKGRCLECKEKISPEYFVLESLNALVYGILYLLLGFSTKFLYMSLFFSVVAILIISDLETQEIPIHFQIPLYIFALLRVLFSPMDPLYALVCALAYFALVESARIIARNFLKREVIGGGDLALIALSGLMLNLEYLPIFFLLVGTLGTLFGLIMTKIRKKNDGPLFPFAPVIILVLYLLLLHHYMLSHSGR